MEPPVLESKRALVGEHVQPGAPSDNARNSPISSDERDNSFFPFSSWEAAAMAALFVSGKMPRTTMDLLLRTLREPGFDPSRLPASVDDLLDQLRKLPVPRVHTMTVDVRKRTRAKQPQIVDTKAVFFFDVEETIRRVLADPQLRPTLDLSPLPRAAPDSQSNLRDTEFCQDPSRFSVLQTFAIRDENGNRQLCRVGDFVQDASGRALLITAVEATATSFRAVCQHWQKRRHRLSSFSPPRILTIDVSSVTAKLTVLQRSAFDAIPAASRDDRVFFADEAVQQQQRELRAVAELPFRHKSGKHLWIKLYLDGERLRSLQCLSLPIPCADFSLYRSRTGKFGGLYFTIGARLSSRLPS